MSLDVCIFAHLKVNCEVMPLRSFANLLSRHRKDLRGDLGHGLFGLCVNPSLATFIHPFSQLCSQLLLALKFDNAGKSMV